MFKKTNCSYSENDVNHISRACTNAETWNVKGA